MKTQTIGILVICTVLGVLLGSVCRSQSNSFALPCPTLTNISGKESMSTPKADSLINEFMQENRIPGLVLGVIKNGTVVVKRGCGVISLDSEITPNENTVFNIGSISKAVTAFGIMYLGDRDLLQLDDPASKYIPNLPSIWRTITIRQFMSHQSGIPQLEPNLPTFNEMLAVAKKRPLSFVPGTESEYNNFNFVVIGKIIEAVSGQDYLDFMREKIFLPLGMKRTGVGFNDANTATGYIIANNNGQLMPVNLVMPPGGKYNIPSGFLQSTLGDLLKLYSAIRNNKLLSSDRYVDMFTPPNPNLRGSPGWMINFLGEEKIVSKDGSVRGYRSVFLFVPNRNHAVILLYNFNSRNNHDKIINNFTNSILRNICNFHPLRD